MSQWNDQSRAAAEKLERYILETEWEDFPPEVQKRAVTCVMDLFATMILCSKTRMAQKGLRLAEEIFQSGDIPVVGSNTCMNMMGAVTAYGYNINALDIDDGHNMIKGHPGSVLIAGLLPAGIRAGASYKEFLTSMVVGYEVAIRAGLALHKYYNFYHGTGSWGAFGVAAGVGRLLKVDRAVLSNALGIADYQGPLAPVMRIVEIPSMNKDGIAWGSITGAMAVEAAKRGISGQFYNLAEPEFYYLINSLGVEYECLNLYFKYFPCCRWAQAAIVCALELRERYTLSSSEIEKVYIRTFKAGTQLSSVKPVHCDEAQYNMLYPVCAALTEGEFTPWHDSEEYIESHPDVVHMMDRVEFVVDDMMEAEFPKKRFAQMEIVKTDGTRLVSQVHEPRGEKEENIGAEWVREKFCATAARYFPSEKREKLFAFLAEVDTKMTLKEMVTFINRSLL